MYWRRGNWIEVVQERRLDCETSTFYAIVNQSVSVSVDELERRLDYELITFSTGACISDRELKCSSTCC